ncbi:hypothetical protein [Ralstonia insidiosa]|uniref:hypothetical protein n=1 Tax=Ralstonia insidiosa TaxID=190721 RepID=UPI000CEEA00E|nr:hypothetical protein [Ralstonia insidiosa]
MHNRIKRTPAETAALLILNAALYGEEKGREVSRCRFTRQSLRQTSGWARLSQPFLDDLFEEMTALGWRLMEHSDTEFAMVLTSKMDVWPKIGNKRLGAMGLLKAPSEQIFQEYDERYPQSDDAIGDEE